MVSEDYDSEGWLDLISLEVFVQATLFPKLPDLSKLSSSGENNRGDGTSQKLLLGLRPAFGTKDFVS